MENNNNPDDEGKGFVDKYVWGSLGAVTNTANSAGGAVYSQWSEFGKKNVEEIETNLALWEDLFGQNVVDSEGKSKTTEEALGRGTYVGIYVGAEWAAPCVPFTPQLKDAYAHINTDGEAKLEVVYVSADKDLPQFKNYISTMPWVSIPFAKLNLRKKVMKIYKAKTLPKFILLAPDGKLLTEDEKWPSIDPEGKYFPWEGSSDSCVLF